MKNKIFLLKVSLDKKIYRAVEINGDKSLCNFAKLITEVFNFDFDHAFGFYNNIKNTYDSDESYELFVDMGEGGSNDETKGVKKTKIRDVFELKKKMLFHFDYGDDWMFLVECLEISDPVSSVKYPRLAKTVGEAPEQYPECE